LAGDPWGKDEGGEGDQDQAELLDSQILHPPFISEEAILRKVFQLPVDP